MIKKEKKEKSIKDKLLVHFALRSITTKQWKDMLKDIVDESRRDYIKKKIKENEEAVEALRRFEGILDNIIEITDILKNETLTKEEIKYYTQRREKLRLQLKEEPFYIIITSQIRNRNKKKEN